MNASETKVCGKCKETKATTEFGRFKDGLQSYCKPCNKAQAKQYNWHKLKLDFSLDDYDALLAKQDGKCAICSGAPPADRSFELDHDHESNKVRGLLCLDCNTGLGKFKDSPFVLEAAIGYLRRHGKS